MRLRRYKKVRGEYAEEEETAEKIVNKLNKRPKESIIPSSITTAKPFGLLRKIIDNPNFNYQLMLISLIFLSDNVPMDRHLEGLSSTVEKIRNVTEVVGGTMNSLKVAAEAPKNIRKLLE